MSIQTNCVWKQTNDYEFLSFGSMPITDDDDEDDDDDDDEDDGLLLITLKSFLAVSFIFLLSSTWRLITCMITCIMSVILSLIFI